MCTNLCIGKTLPLTVAGGASSGAVQQKLLFVASNNTINYGNLEIRDNGAFFCCQNIGTTKFGLKVVGSTLHLEAPFTNRFMTIQIPTNTARKPKFGIEKVGGDYYFIGIDDIRQDYATSYFKFLLNGNSRSGVNISFLNNTLIVEGGYNI